MSCNSGSLSKRFMDTCSRNSVERPIKGPSEVNGSNEARSPERRPHPGRDRCRRKGMGHGRQELNDMGACQSEDICWHRHPMAVMKERTLTSPWGAPNKMSAIHSNPRISTLRRKGMEEREQWTIRAANPMQGYTALHEVNEMGAVSEVTQRVQFSNKLDLDNFCSKLIAQGWNQFATPTRYEKTRFLT